LKLGWP